VQGLEHLPSQGAAIVVCNHRSDTDGLLLTLALPRYIAWMVADYMMQIPVTHQLLSLTGMIAVNTEGKPTPTAIKRTLQRLQQGQLIGIFPEGEDYIFANDFAAPLAPFKPGFARLARTAHVPVIPLVIVPLAETLAPIQIPPAVRPHLERHYDLTHVTQIARYRTVEIRIGPAIAPAAMPPASKAEQVDWLSQQTRQAMVDLQQSDSE
jgi:1-acyl-sn-glycerol-3-phosphate acyltransferase